MYTVQCTVQFWGLLHLYSTMLLGISELVLCISAPDTPYFRYFCTCYSIILGISVPATPSFQLFLYLLLRHFRYFCTCYSCILVISATATPSFQVFLHLLLRHFRYCCTCYSIFWVFCIYFSIVLFIQKPFLHTFKYFSPTPPQF